MIAICPKHGPVPANSFIHAPGMEVKMSGNTISCPQCGRPSKIPDGTYKFDEEGLIKSFKQGSFSKEEMRKVKDWSEDFITTGGSIDEFQVGINAISPPIAKTLSPYLQLLKPEHFFSWLTALISVISLFTQGVGGNTTNVYHNTTNYYNNSTVTNESHSKALERMLREKRLADSTKKADSLKRSSKRPKSK